MAFKIKKKKVSRKYLYAWIKAQQAQLEKSSALLYYSNKERDKLRKFTLLYLLTILYEKIKGYFKRR